MAMDPNVMGGLYSMMYQLNKMYPQGANQSGPDLSAYNPSSRGGAPVQGQGQNNQYQPPQMIYPQGNMQAQQQAQVPPPSSVNRPVALGQQHASYGQIPTNNIPMGQISSPDMGQAKAQNSIPTQQGTAPNASTLQQFLQGLQQNGQTPSGGVSMFIQKALQQGIDPQTIMNFISGQTGLKQPKR